MSASWQPTSTNVLQEYSLESGIEAQQPYNWENGSTSSSVSIRPLARPKWLPAGQWPIDTFGLQSDGATMASRPNNMKPRVGSEAEEEPAR